MEFFKPIEVYESFELFSVPHLIALAILTVACLAIVFLRKVILKSEKRTRNLRLTIAWALIIQQTAFYLWKISANEFTLDQILPLNLCSIAIFLAIYILLSQNNRFYPLLYYIGMCGALQALLTPSMDGYNYPHFRFFQFFTGHNLIIIAIIFMAFVMQYKVDLKDTVVAFFQLQVVALMAGLANVFTGGNYMFLARKPDSTSLFSIMADWPFYIVQLEVIVVILMLLLSIPYMIHLKKDFVKKSKLKSISQNT